MKRVLVPCAVVSVLFGALITLAGGGSERAVVVVKVPDAAAELDINGFRPPDVGLERVFSTPPLAPGKEFMYAIVATWQEKGETKKDSRAAIVRAGGRTVVDFTIAPLPVKKIEIEVPKKPTPKKVTPPEVKKPTEPTVDPKKVDPETPKKVVPPEEPKKVVPETPKKVVPETPKKVVPPEEPKKVVPETPKKVVPPEEPKKVVPETPKKVVPEEPKKTPEEPKKPAPKKVDPRDTEPKYNPKKVDPKDDDSPFSSLGVRRLHSAFASMSGRELMPGFRGQPAHAHRSAGSRGQRIGT